MPCINPDGKPTETGKKVLRALKDGGLSSAEKVSESTGIALFRVRSGLRDMMEIELVELKMDKYSITEKGSRLVE
jgi:predicted transcriptional regulator